MRKEVMECPKTFHDFFFCHAFREKVRQKRFLRAGGCMELQDSADTRVRLQQSLLVRQKDTRIYSLQYGSM